ncbi:MAG: 2-oxoacid:ferredoxin oxidoreductase subunit beta [Acidimicrobiia bacterium]|nr:2-oxoacid:ferredoxin oxidoreductase subunit beta [bacterium]MCY3579358.1 2-oxoacid:ferredoxin oxidoreductase subunit beta [bacterium]MCY3653402.1 2-oxoacid:ferredoxin oxidoreductase subunit beta [bacterium]MXZ06672.1 2-oxoacid:ferredoxin oxidoreductase subunit beta [Acidimicrobiia bacterium]MYF25792.1 2-oxoacid:ferredoxin oxidoreductase subunit beta [Acidimicrobiia bacterium]
MTYTRVDFQTDQEVRWCPGCGDYTILASVQNFMANAGVDRENVVFVSGIGCAARFPYYMNVYGMHSIHGRAPAIATGVAITNPDLSVWVVGGDGDLLSIGGNHLIHAMRRNLDLTILLFNNQIYGLTKGQYSPTSEPGKSTKSSPGGSIDYPFNPVSLALGSEATFVARTLDMDRKHTTDILTAAHTHKGAALIEIYQNCNVFNDKAFIQLTGKTERYANRIDLVHGEPIIFGADKEKAVVWSEGGAKIVDRASVNPNDIIVHDAHAEDVSAAFALSRISHGPYGPTPLGVFRDVYRPVYDQVLDEEVASSQAARGKGDLLELITGLGTWTVD